ncbi:DUF2889 domain-containing protein [Sphingobium psychrophilum]|uniref:DUF2889 domain-containing protein n=1 Tax=Sphingobium psychrophilum TaxID=2728834 RepID=UPI002E2B0F6C|nr:DUF2889 domain-containing protein [Sphingobium psychrophilum]
MSLSHVPINPDYGNGCFRRLVRTFRVPGRILLTLDDTHHSMWLLLHHFSGRISNVEACVARGPATSCGTATLALNKLIGLAIDEDMSAFHERLPPILNCTHLMDMAHWAFRSATGQVSLKREVLIEIPDEAGAPVWIAVERDGIVVHRWYVKDHHVVEPGHLAGRPLMKGFMSWAREQFSGEDLDLAIMLQRGVFVARGRRHLVDLSPPVPLSAAPAMRDACHSYSPAHFETATSVVGYVRDFTDSVVAAPLPPSVTAYFKGFFQ